jgi:hypothetical protein
VAVVFGGGGVVSVAVVRGGGIAHLGLVELRHLDAHAAPRPHPALGDGGGVHAVALLRLKLRGARARRLCLGLARLLCLPRLLLIGRSRILALCLVCRVCLVLQLVALRLVALWRRRHTLPPPSCGALGHRHAACVGLRGARVWWPRGGRAASLGARLAKERF